MASSSPSITSVSWNENTNTVVITGSGFGTQPAYNSDNYYLEFYDVSGNWDAGWLHQFGNSSSGDWVTTNVTSWSNSQIVVSGFTGWYGAFGWNFNPGDEVQISVWNANQNSLGTPATYTETVPSAGPTTTVPPSADVTAGVSTPISGISVSDPNAAGFGQTVTVVLSDQTGALSATVAGSDTVTGVNTTALTISGDLNDLNSTLATVAYDGAIGTATSDAVDVKTSDSNGGSDDHQIAVDVTQPITTPPTVVHVTAIAPDGIRVGPGDTVNFLLTMSEATTVSGGTPMLVLSNGGLANFDQADSTSTGLMFDYTVQAGWQAGPSAQVLTITGTNLEGASITNAQGVEANLSGAETDTAGGLGIYVGAFPSSLKTDFNEAALNLQNIGLPQGIASTVLSVAGDIASGANPISDVGDFLASQVFTPIIAVIPGVSGNTADAYGSALSAGLDILGIAGAALGVGAGTVAASPALAVAALGASIFSAVYDGADALYNWIASDPPNLDFTTVTAPPTLSFQLPSALAGAPSFALFNTTTTDLLSYFSYVDAELNAAQKYDGAILTGNTASAALQWNAFTQYSNSVNQADNTVIADLNALSPVLSSINTSSFSATTAQINAAITTLEGQSLPANILAVIESATGLSAATINADFAQALEQYNAGTTTFSLAASISSVTASLNFGQIMQSVAASLNFGQITQDVFTQDSSPNSSLWTVNGPVATAAMKYFDANPTATIISPTITFSPTLGLEMSSPAGTYQQGGIQSVESFTGTFTVTASGLASSINAGVLQLSISSQNGGTGVSIDGGRGGVAASTGFDYSCPSGPGTHWNELGQLSASAPVLNELYTETISVNALGIATVSVSEGGTQLGEDTVSVGTGPFYVILSEGSGAFSSGNPNQADWSSISVTTNPIVSNITGNQSTLTAPFTNSTVEGGGYDILNMSQNPIATASSAYAETSNHNGTFNLTTTGSTDVVSGIMQVQFSDKTVTVAANGSENEFIALLYQGALGRTPDATGLAGWEQIGAALPSTATQSLGLAYALSDTSGGYNGSLSIAAGFTQSAEFIAKYGTLTPTQFVTQLYANILDRAPDPAGLAGWLAQLSAGASQAHVLVGFADSAEAINNATLGYTGQSGTHPSWLFLT